MPKPATLSLPPPGSAIAVMAGYVDPAVEVAIPDTLQPTDTPDTDWLHALLHHGWEFAWRELSAKAAALGAFLLEQAQAVLLHQAVDYCAGLTDWATQSIAARFIDAQDWSFSAGQSLMHAAAAAMPSSHQVCDAALTQLPAQANALLAHLLAGYTDDTNPHDPAGPATAENANSTLITCAFADLADAAIGTPCAPQHAGTLIDPDLDWQLVTHAHDMLSVECPLPDSSASVCLVGDWDASSFTPGLP